VTLRARDGDVGAGQRERGKCGVVKGSRAPGNAGVAYAAIMRESSLHVVRVCRAREVFLVASETVSGCALVLASGVARRAV